jgi:hypothetical protein
MNECYDLLESGEAEVEKVRRRFEEYCGPKYNVSSYERYTCFYQLESACPIYSAVLLNCEFFVNC